MCRNKVVNYSYSTFFLFFFFSNEGIAGSDERVIKRGKSAVFWLTSNKFLEGHRVVNLTNFFIHMRVTELREFFRFLFKYMWKRQTIPFLMVLNVSTGEKLFTVKNINKYMHAHCFICEKQKEVVYFPSFLIWIIICLYDYTIVVKFYTCTLPWCVIMLFNLPADFHLYKKRKYLKSLCYVFQMLNIAKYLYLRRCNL